MQSIFHSLCLLIACNLYQPNVNNLELPKKDKVAIEVDNGKFKINGKTADPQWSYTFFSKILGKPSKDDDMTDVKECYHTKGIVTWKGYSNENIIDQLLVQFAYDPNQTWYDSKVFFSGTVKVDGLTITKRTKPEELTTKLPNYNWFKNTSGWYEGHYMNMFMYMAFDDAEQNLLWIDFGLE